MLRLTDSRTLKTKADFVAKAEALGLPACTRAYRTAGDRNRAIAMLARRGYNYFTCYPAGGDSEEKKANRYGLMFHVNFEIRHVHISR